MAKIGGQRRFHADERRLFSEALNEEKGVETLEKRKGAVYRIRLSRSDITSSENRIGVRGHIQKARRAFFTSNERVWKIVSQVKSMISSERILT